MRQSVFLTLAERHAAMYSGHSNWHCPVLAGIERSCIITVAMRD